MEKIQTEIPKALLAKINKSHDGIRKSRAERIARKMMNAQESMIRQLTDEVIQLQDKLDDLLDLAPDTTVSLNVASENFDEREMIRSIQNTKLTLANKRIELQIAQGTMDDFTGEQTSAADASELA